MTDKNLYFILSSSCKLVKGFKRCVVIDYSRGDLYFISHEYLDLLTKLDRQRISDIEQELEDDSSQFFFSEFIEVITNLEIGFLVKDPESFPKISEAPEDDAFVSIMDTIIEVDEEFYSPVKFNKICNELSDLNCKDFQIRVLSPFNFSFLKKIVEQINTTKANYIEIHCTYSPILNVDQLRQFVEDQPLISNIYVYSSNENTIIDVINDIPDRYLISLGKIYFIEYPFNDGNCCGLISQENLNYTSFYLHNLLKTRNGCLDRKLSIDRFGNLKNCPSMNIEYGNIENVSIKKTIENESFKKYWFIHKDQISICKVCEFRYNCTDCRAFLQDKNDIYSKPLKCGYDPYTCTWEGKNGVRQNEKMILENLTIKV